MTDFIVPGLIFKAESAYINMTVLHGTHQTTTQQLQTQDTTLQHASTLTNNKSYNKCTPKHVSVKHTHTPLTAKAEQEGTHQYKQAHNTIKMNKTAPEFSQAILPLRKRRKW